MNNPYFPLGQDDIDKDSLADDTWDFACEMYETDEPNEWQLAQAGVELEAYLRGKFV